MYFVQSYDLILLTETWTSSISNIDIDGYESINCPRPKCNRKAKRDSGGIVIYYKHFLHNKIELIKLNTKGILWLKIKGQSVGVENDLYFCTCYVPPEESSVYKNIRSSLYEFDFFDQLNNDILHYSNLGDVYLMGDLNSRTGDRPDYIENIELNRYIDMPFDNQESLNLIERKSVDKNVNVFGNKLLTLCKEQNLSIVNGRLEEGKFTYHCINRNRVFGSVVDYLITNAKKFENIFNMTILDTSEFSDHCPIEFSMKNCCNINQSDDFASVDKLIWDTSKSEHLNFLLQDNVNIFETITNEIVDNIIPVDTGISRLTDIIYESSFQVFGKTFKSTLIAKINHVLHGSMINVKMQKLCF